MSLPRISGFILGRALRALLLVAAILLSGCQAGRMSMNLRNFHGVPLPQWDVLPQQWEPENSTE